MEKEFKEISKNRFDLDNDLRILDNEINKENDENYISKMTIIKDKEFEQLQNKRFELEVKLNDDLIKVKD